MLEIIVERESSAKISEREGSCNMTKLASGGMGVREYSLAPNEYSKVLFSQSESAVVVRQQGIASLMLYEDSN